LLRNLETDSEAEDTESNATSEPCLVEFERYLNTIEAVPEDVNVVEWWGVCDLLIPLEFQISHA